MTATKLSRGRAVVIGGSITGMLAAKVLSAYFKQVIILEKDDQPKVDAHEPGSFSRQGLPHAAHQHLLLVKGRQLFEEFFPGFDEELERLGAPLVNYSEDVALFIGEGKLPRFASGLNLRVCRRPVIDNVVARRIGEIDNVESQYQCRVNDLILNEAKDRICGVRYQQGGSVLEDKSLTADLILDCSGRGSKMHRWLQRNGFCAVPRTRVNPKLAYASQLYKVKQGHKVKPIEVAPHAPESPRAAGFWPVEKGYWLLTLIGMNAVSPGAEQKTFNEFAGKLSSNSIAKSLQFLEPVSAISHFQGTENVWSRYDQMKDHPAGLLVMGDAMCAFNPLYGQGLTLIAMAAKALEKRLNSGQKQGFSAKWVKGTYRRFNRFFFVAWMVAVSEDMRWPETQGRNLAWYLKLSYLYMDRILDACVYSKGLAHQCLSIANMVSSPFHLIRPDNIFRALWYSRGLRSTHSERL